MNINIYTITKKSAQLQRLSNQLLYFKITSTLTWPLDISLAATIVQVAEVYLGKVPDTVYYLHRQLFISIYYWVWLWSSDCFLTDKNAPQPHLQKGKFPFGCHYAAAIPGPTTSTNYISRISAQLKPHNWQRNQQWSRDDQQRLLFLQVSTSFKLHLLSCK